VLSSEALLLEPQAVSATAPTASPAMRPTRVINTCIPFRLSSGCGLVPAQPLEGQPKLADAKNARHLTWTDGKCKVYDR
jgi:hypothetical protein